MLTESAAICDSNMTSAVCKPWSHAETTSLSQVIIDLCACVDRTVGRRRAMKDTRERWYAAVGVKPSSEDPPYRSEVQIITFVEEGQLE